jgi:hypothetical protein
MSILLPRMTTGTAESCSAVMILSNSDLASARRPLSERYVRARKYTSDAKCNDKRRKQHPAVTNEPVCAIDDEYDGIDA